MTPRHAKIVRAVKSALKTPVTVKMHTPAPRVLRRHNIGVSTSLPPGAAEIVDSLIGTIYGAKRAEVLRFIVISWLHTNSQLVIRKSMGQTS